MNDEDPMKEELNKRGKLYDNDLYKCRGICASAEVERIWSIAKHTIIKKCSRIKPPVFRQFCFSTTMLAFEEIKLSLKPFYGVC